MSKKLFYLVSILLIATFVLVSCAPAATVAPTSAPAATQPPAATNPPAATMPPAATQPPAATTAPTKAPAPAAVKITIWHQWSGDYLTAITAAFKDYETAHPGVTIDLNKPQDVQASLKVAIPAGEGPDIIEWANDSIGSAATTGYIVPLDDYKIDNAFLKSTYEPAAVNGVTWKGKIWALPEAQEAIALVYNKALVTSKYLPKDSTDFAGLLAAAQQFQKDNPGKTLVCNQGFPGGDAYHIAPVFFGFGVPQYIDETGKVTINTPEGVKAMQWLTEMAKVSLKEQTQDICNAGVKAGTVGMMWTGPWDIATMETNKVDYGIFPMGKPFVGIKTMMLSKNAVDRKTTTVALDIMKYFTSADVQKKLSLANKTIPAATAALKDPAVSALLSITGFGAAANLGTPMSSSPFAGAQWTPVGDAVKTIWTGSQTPDAALKDAQAAAEKLVAAMQ
jgi:arabinogalactan oligomer / maltooligosaccharide transport system substrate-binding protein